MGVGNNELKWDFRPKSVFVIYTLLVNRKLADFGFC